QAQVPGQDNLTWGHYLRDAVNRVPLATEGPATKAISNGNSPSSQRGADKPADDAPIEAVALPAKPTRKAAAPKKAATAKAPAAPGEKPAKAPKEKAEKPAKKKK
ncbi:MAG TPA: hypothetical protein VGC22_13460, partial [Chitinophaga sp.]